MPQPPGTGEPSRPERRPADAQPAAALAATAPARWLLEAARDGGVALTQTNALARTIVREAAERWPNWWDADLFGPPHREADLAVLEALHDGLCRLKLIRRRARKLHATVRGRELAADPEALMCVLASDLGGGDRFSATVATVVMGRLSAGAPCAHDELVVPALAQVRREGWRDPDGQAPSERDVSWTVSDVLRRAEAYGVIERRPDPSEAKRWRSQILLSAGGALAFRVPEGEGTEISLLVFDAKLLGVPGVSARLAVVAHEHLTTLHDMIQEAFAWQDDHLYSFWLDGRYWGSKSAEFARPGTPDHDSPTADVPLAELDLSVGRQIAYVFDYGDEWRVELTLRSQGKADGGPYPCVLERRGTAPPAVRYVRGGLIQGTALVTRPLGSPMAGHRGAGLLRRRPRASASGRAASLREVSLTLPALTPGGLASHGLKKCVVGRG